MKRNTLIVFALLSCLLIFSGATVMAQEEVPPPYAGMHNPFPWDDESIQQAGKEVYQRSCLGCHGIDGSNIAAADFSTPEFTQEMEDRPDLSFWILSEGKLSKGMPPFKSTLSEEQRWQVMTYMWSLGKTPSPGVPQEPTSPPVEAGNMILTVPKQVEAGQPLTLKVTLRDDQDKPISGAVVELLLKVDFFTSGLMDIGEATTDGSGAATFEFTPQVATDTEIVARYGTAEVSSPVNITAAGGPLYQAEAGIRLPAPGKPVFIGPESALHIDEMGSAPTSAFYLPGGILSWLLIVVAAVVAIWFTYFRVMYQLYRIPVVDEFGNADTRLIPRIGMAIVLLLGIVLTLMLLTGPYSHFHLLQ